MVKKTGNSIDITNIDTSHLAEAHQLKEAYESMQMQISYDNALFQRDTQKKTKPKSFQKLEKKLQLEAKSNSSPRDSKDSRYVVNKKHEKRRNKLGSINNASGFFDITDLIVETPNQTLVKSFPENSLVTKTFEDDKGV